MGENRWAIPSENPPDIHVIQPGNGVTLRTSSTGAKNQLQGDDNGHVGRPSLDLHVDTKKYLYTIRVWM